MYKWDPFFTESSRLKHEPHKAVLQGWTHAGFITARGSCIHWNILWFFPERKLSFSGQIWWTHESQTLTHSLHFHWHLERTLQYPLVILKVSLLVISWTKCRSWPTDLPLPKNLHYPHVPHPIRKGGRKTACSIYFIFHMYLVHFLLLLQNPCGWILCKEDRFI